MTLEDEEDKSLAEALGEAYDASIDDDGEPAEVPQEEPVEEEETEELPLAAEAETPNEEEVVEVDEPSLSDQPAEEEEVYSPPVSWSAEDRAVFGKLPRDAQEIVLRRESERDQYLNQKAGEIAQYQRQVADIEKVIEPHKQDWALEGETPSQVISRLVAFENLAEENPLQAIQYLADSYGVDMRQLSQAPQQPVDPRYQELMARQEQMEDYVAQQQQVQQQQTYTNAEVGIAQFASATDENGELLHPDFLELQDTMAPIVSSLRAASPHKTHEELLREAYKAASVLNPATQQRYLERERKAWEAEKREAQKKKVSKAKKAAKSVKGAPAPSLAAEEADDIRSTLLNAWDEAAA